MESDNNDESFLQPTTMCASSNGDDAVNDVESTDTAFLDDGKRVEVTVDPTSVLKNSGADIPSPSPSVIPSVDSLDRLTAVELLQLLKEYKKREFLYVSQLAHLQHELHLKTNASQAPLVTDVTSVPVPFEISPSVYHDISTVVHNALIDPTVNLEIRELRLKLYEQGVELQKTKDELKASTFSPDSVMGRRLINRCKALQAENTDIGKMLIEMNLKPLQIQIDILQHQLIFFKQQLKTLYSMIVDVEEDNDLLTKQLQNQTMQYKALQKERDELIKKVEQLELEAKVATEEQKVKTLDKARSERRRRQSPSKEDKNGTFSRKSVPEINDKTEPQKLSNNYRSETHSPTRHRYRKVIESNGAILSSDSRGSDRKESQRDRSSRRATTSPTYISRGHDERSRRRRGQDTSHSIRPETKERAAAVERRRSSNTTHYQ